MLLRLSSAAVVGILCALFVVACGDAVSSRDASDDAAGDVVAPSDRTVTDAAGDVVAPTDRTITPSAHSRCATALVVMDGTTLWAEDLADGLSNFATCEQPGSSAALFYTAHVPAGSQVTAAAIPRVPIEMQLRIVTTCDATTCLSESTPSSGPASASYYNSTSSDRTVIIVASAMNWVVGAPQPFDLSVTIRPPPANTLCTSATRVVDGTVLTSEDLAYATETVNSCDGLATAPALFYAVDIPAGNALTAIVATPAPFSAPLMRLVPSCDASTCLAGTSSGGDALRYTNTGSTTITAILEVSGSRPGLDGPFSLTISIGPPPANASCSMPTPITDGSVLTNQDLMHATDVSTACFPALDGHVLFYSARVPAGNTLIADTGPPSGSAMQLRLIRDCTDTTCLTWSLPLQNRLVWSNTSSTEALVILEVGTAFASPWEGMFTLSTIIRPTPASAVCRTAPVVTNGTRLTNESTTFATEYVVPCASIATPSSFYSATIPSGESITVRATRTSSPPPEVRILDSCGATSCLADSPIVDAASVVRYTNTGSSPMNVVIAVTLPLSAATFDLAITIEPTPTSVACSTATPVTNGTHLVGVDGGWATQPGVPCDTFSSGPVLFYSADVPAGQTLTVTTAPATGGGGNFPVRVLAACGASSCLADSGPASSPTVAARYTNTGLSTASVIIEVSGNPVDLFDMRVWIEPPRYIETMIPTACDDMAGGTPIPGLRSDFVSSSEALPIERFQYFGEAVTSYSVSSSGFIQLYAGTSGFGTRTLSNVPLPDLGAPPGMVAPFWDELFGGSTYGMTTKNFTTGTPHFTIAWSGWGFCCGSGDGGVSDGSRLSFQIKLFPSTNVIEMHYCELVGGGASPVRSSGASATIGLQDTSGSRGVLHSFDTAGAVDTTHALRFTPNP